MTAKSRKKKQGGRRKLYTDRIQLPLAPGVIKRIDLVRRDGETRLALIRHGIELAIAERYK